MFSKVNEENKIQEYVLKIVFIFTIIVTVTFFFSKKYLIAIKIFDVILIMLIGTLNIICNDIVNKKKYIYSSLLGITSIIITLTQTILFLIAFDLKEEIFLVNLIIIIFIVRFIAEYGVVIMAIFYSKKKISYKKISRKSIYEYLILIIFILIMANNINHLKLINILVKSKYLLILMNIILFITTIKLLNNNIFNKNMYKVTKKYIILIFLNQLTFFILLYILKAFSLKLLYIFNLIKFIAYYILYKEALLIVLNESFNEVKTKIINSEKRFKKSNNLLKKKTSTLIELSNLTETGDDNYINLIQSIGDSLFIFKDESLNYINDMAVNLLGFNNASMLLKKSFSDIYNLIINLEIATDNKKNFQNGYYKQAVLKSSTGRFIDVEIYLLPFEKKSKLILIRDVTLINRTRKVNSYLEKHFQEEYVKRDFFSNISHELRTPINVIFSALQLNDIYLIENNISGISKNNKMIKQNCLRLIRTINNFIDANKLSEGFISPDLHVFNVVEIVENIAQAANKHIKKAKLELIFDAEREEIFIELDKGFLERVVLNILSNSVKYGQIDGEILINIFIKNNNILIVIENDGNTISEEEQQYMFEKFSKNNMAFNRTQEGSGLGLYISKSLMELQGGNLTVEVGVKKGNKFVISYNDVRIFNEEEIFDSYVPSLNEIMEKVDIEFSDITI